MRFRFTAAIVLFAWVLAALAGRGQQAPARVIPIPYSDARPVLESLAEALPPELSGRSPAELEAAWPEWVRQRDVEIRARLERGDEDSIVNLMLFGTRFTRTPRITPENLAKLNRSETATPLEGSAAEFPAAPWLLSRISDLVTGAAAPGSNEHLLFARAMLAQRGINPATPEGAAAARKYLLQNLARVVHEQESFQQALAAARELGNPSEEFAERSTLYRQRGLSLDSSLSIQWGIEKALEDLKARGVLTPGSVHHVAVIGPGLDFTDKAAGYDFYPPQTMQPFAVMDSLLRLGLAAEKDWDVVTLDLSPRVNEHILRARDRARRGLGYTIILPLPDSVPWKEGTRSYWKRFGDRLGTPTTAPAPPAAAGPVHLRAVRVRPSFVLRARPLDVNMVLERPAPEASLPSFDLVIATNILVYYGVFEQSLALENIAQLLRPGGLLLSNNALLEIPALRMHSIGYVTVVYSDRSDDGDHIVWYQLATNP